MLRGQEGACLLTLWLVAVTVVRDMLWRLREEEELPSLRTAIPKTTMLLSA
jgi:hypothetical protein